MNKIFAVLVTLLFVASVFGVTQTIAESGCPCALATYSQYSVQVGDTFTFTRQVDCTTHCNYHITAVPGTPSETIFLVSSVISNGFETMTFKALAPGKVTFTSTDCGCSIDTATITITPKEYPMLSFMKILGFGKKD